MSTTLKPRYPDPGYLWKTNNSSGVSGVMAVDKVGGAILFLSPNTMEVISSYPLPGVHEMAISPDRKIGYAAQFGKWGKNASGVASLIDSRALVWLFDLQTQTPICRIDTFPHVGPHGMKFDNDGNLWVTFESNALGLIDTKSRVLVDAWDLGEPMQPPRTLEIDEEGTKLYCTGKGDDIIVFNIASRSIKSRIPLKGGATSLTATPDGKRLITFDKFEQDLLVIDIQKDEIVERHAYKGAVLSSLAASRFVHARYSPNGQCLATCNYAGASVHIHDAKNLAEHNTMLIAKGPQGLAFSDDSRVLHVANHDCGLITSIDIESGQKIGCISSGGGIESFSFY